MKLLRFTVSTLFCVSQLTDNVIATGGHRRIRANVLAIAKDAAFVRTDGIKPFAGSPPSPDALKESWPKEWIESHGEQALLQSQNEATVWANEVREAMRHTWKGYKERAWGYDSVSPVSGSPSNWCQMAVTMIDGMSTLYLMGLKDEFNGAVSFLQQANLPGSTPHGKDKFFEINIRALGGLLSSYSLSKNPVLLETAQRLGDKLYMAFKNGPHQLPDSMVDLGDGSSQGGSSNIAELGTFQLEFRALSQMTGDQKYATAADNAEQVLLNNGPGLIPNDISSLGKPLGSHLSFGGAGDSYYEYLLKTYIQRGQKDKDHALKEHWKHCMLQMQNELVVTTKGGTTFLADKEGGRLNNQMGHLACFVPGMLMLGSRSLPKEDVDAKWEPLAEKLTQTCNKMYTKTASGLSPDVYYFDVDDKGDGMTPGNDVNLLRPEAAEALYYRWYYTGDHKYRKMAHSMFQAFEKHAKTKYGYSETEDLDSTHPLIRNSQESFWLAETLKYLYLIQAPRNTLDLDKWVLNTEAQPLPIVDK